MRFLIPAPLEQDQILNFGKMAAALFPAITIPWSLDVMEQVAGRVNDASDGFMFICNDAHVACGVAPLLGTRFYLFTCPYFATPT